MLFSYKKQFKKQIIIQKQVLTRLFGIIVIYTFFPTIENKSYG